MQKIAANNAQIIFKENQDVIMTGNSCSSNQCFHLITFMRTLWTKQYSFCLPSIVKKNVKKSRAPIPNV